LWDSEAKDLLDSGGDSTLLIVDDGINGLKRIMSSFNQFWMEFFRGQQRF